MIGSATVGAWIALVVFWIVLGIGWAFGELGPGRCALFAGLWVGINLAFRALGASEFFPPSVALLDIVLVLMVFKSDIRLT